MKFNERLKEARLYKQLKTTEVALQLEITERAYYYYEKGCREPSLELLVKICKLFDVSADYLLGLSEY